MLLRAGADQPAVRGRTGWQADPVSFEQLVMGYLQRPATVTTPDDPAPAAQRPGPNTKAVPQ